VPDDFKETEFQKIEKGVKYWPRKTNLLLLFFSEILKKLLAAYVENTLNGEKVFKLSISRFIRGQHEKNFRSSLSAQDRFV
jgi:hypothetical protein